MVAHTASAKRHFNSFSKNLREEMKPHGVKVTTIIAGAAFSDSWAESGIDRNQFMETEDIAKMVYATSQLSPQACVEEILNQATIRGYLKKILLSVFVSNSSY